MNSNHHYQQLLNYQIFNLLRFFHLLKDNTMAPSISKTFSLNTKPSVADVGIINKSRFSALMDEALHPTEPKPTTEIQDGNPPNIGSSQTKEMDKGPWLIPNKRMKANGNSQTTSGNKGKTVTFIPIPKIIPNIMQSWTHIFQMVH